MRWIVLVVVLVVVLVAGCGGSFLDPSAATSPSADIFFPRHSLTGRSGLPTGEITALLQRADACLVLVDEQGNAYLALWPPGSDVEEAADGITVRDAGGRALGRVGEMVQFGGGAYSQDQREFVEELIGESVDPTCSTNGYWLVSEAILR